MASRNASRRASRKPVGQTRPTSPLKPDASQTLATRPETRAEMAYRLRWRVRAGLLWAMGGGWLLLWFAWLADSALMGAFWALPGLGLLLWAEWRLWRPAPDEAQPVLRMQLRAQRKRQPETPVAVRLGPQLYTSSGAIVHLPPHWVGREVTVSPSAIDAEVCGQQRLLVRLGHQLSLEREGRWLGSGAWRTHLMVVLMALVVLAWARLPQATWHAAQVQARWSLQPPTAVPTPTLDELLAAPPRVGDIVHVRAPVQCSEVATAKGPGAVPDCRGLLWGEAPRAALLVLADHVEPWLPWQPRTGTRAEVGFFARVTGVQPGTALPLVLQLDPRISLYPANDARMLVLIGWLSGALVLLHAGLALLQALLRGVGLPLMQRR